jgi:hypothetical protein
MNKHAWGAAALLILAGCGGGSDDSSSTASTPAAAAAQLRTAMSVQQARPAAAASAADAAEQLLDFAEASFPAYFPVHQSTSTLDPFRFRHYPQTGVYVGVVVKPGMGYTMDGVYVMGGPFGEEPVYVGQISAFITGTGGSTGTNNGCFDLGLFETTGTHVELTLKYSGNGEDDVFHTEVWTINGPTTFEGHDAIETQTRLTVTAKDSTLYSETETKSYDKRTGDAEFTTYGSESWSRTSTPGGPLTSHGREVHTPPSVARLPSLAVGQSITESTTARRTSTLDIPGLPYPTSVTTETTTETTKFVGREQVSVPANSYSTCRFESTNPSEPNTVTTFWVIDGKGFAVKIQTTVNRVVQSTHEATSVKLNGQSL